MYWFVYEIQKDNTRSGRRDVSGVSGVVQQVRVCRFSRRWGCQRRWTPQPIPAFSATTWLFVPGNEGLEIAECTRTVQVPGFHDRFASFKAIFGFPIGIIAMLSLIASVVQLGIAVVMLQIAWRQENPTTGHN